MASAAAAVLSIATCTALSTAWGTLPTSTGKLVWATVLPRR
ncbi:MAG TPA: hypothetical protein VFG35_00065 [Actinoplanes sp.]|nr:hypothetical protein [Actinoplanes sp.]